jgi:hypothetical protein
VCCLLGATLLSVVGSPSRPMRSRRLSGKLLELMTMCRLCHGFLRRRRGIGDGWGGLGRVSLSTRFAGGGVDTREGLQSSLRLARAHGASATPSFL